MDPNASESSLSSMSPNASTSSNPRRRYLMRRSHRSAFNGERLPLFTAADDFIDEMINYLGSSTASKDREGSKDKPGSFGFASTTRQTLKNGIHSENDKQVAKLEEYEDEERRELERIRDEYFMTAIHEFSYQFFQVRVPAVPQNVKYQLYGMFFRRVRAFTSIQFLNVFGRGIRRCALSAVEVASLASALYCLDAIVVDDDLHNLVYPATGTKFGIDTCPEESRFAWFAFMAAKHCFLKAECDLEDFRLIYVKAKYDKQLSADMPPRVRMTMSLLDSAALFLQNSPIFKEMTRDFYNFCVALEEQYFGECPENTIPFEYQRGEMVGSGAFGKVYRCVNAKFGTNVALKEVRLPRQLEKERTILVEVSTLKSLSHENIVKLQGYNIDRERRVIHILMEFCQHSLRFVIDQHGGLTASLIQHYARQLLNGLAYLHSENVIHRDIKAANVLVDGSVAKLTDFGTAYRTDELDEEDDPLMEDGQVDTTATDDISGTLRQTSSMPEDLAAENDLEYARRAAAGFRRDRQKPEKRAAVAGTPLFIAPELLKGVLPSEASDVWAFGCVVFEMITAEYPWRELTGGASLPMPLFSYRLCQAEEPPQLPEGISLPATLKSFLYACLDLDPTKRPSAMQLLKHDFLSEEFLTPAGSATGADGAASGNPKAGEVVGIAGKAGGSQRGSGSDSMATTDMGFSLIVGSTVEDTDSSI